MTYAHAAVLQEAVYQHLTGDADVQSLSAGHVYDALPTGALPDLYVTIGPEKVRDAGDGLGKGAWHDFDISVVSEQAGFQGAKALAAAVSTALENAPLVLAQGRRVGRWFRSAKAAQVSAQRRVNLSFRARVEP